MFGCLKRTIPGRRTDVARYGACAAPDTIWSRMGGYGMPDGCFRKCSQVRTGTLAVWKANWLVSAHPGSSREDDSKRHCLSVCGGSCGATRRPRQADGRSGCALEVVHNGQVSRDCGMGP